MTHRDWKDGLLYVVGFLLAGALILYSLARTEAVSKHFFNSIEGGQNEKETPEP